MSRQSRVVVLALTLSFAAACPDAHAAAIVGARGVVGPAAAARLAARGIPARGSVLSPAEEHALAERVQRSRAFPHVLSAPHVDWSAAAARRPGVPRSPRAAARHTRAALAASAQAFGPPDTLRVAFIRIDFANDRGGDASTGDGHFDLSGPDPNAVPIDPPPRNRSFYQGHGEALARYYDVQTYGRVVVQVEVWPRSENGAYSASDMADFGPWEFSTDIYRAAVHMFRSFLFAADTQSVALGDRIPWDSYDRIVLIHAGSDLQNDVARNSSEDIPSFTIGVDDTDRVIFADSLNRPIDRASFIPETINQDIGLNGLYGAINGVLAHECGHLFFGFFDAYDIETGQSVVGDWSLMDSGNLVGAKVPVAPGDTVFATGILPPSIDPLQRAWTTDAISYTEMPLDGSTTTFRSSQRHPDIFPVALTSDEYLLIENRHQAPAEVVELDQDSVTHVILGPKSPDRFEYDALLEGGGLLVWHVDQSVIPLEFAFPLDTALRVNPDFGLNSNPFRHGLELIEGDGLQDVGDPSSPFYAIGSPRDPWYVGNATALGDTTIPNLIPHIGTRPHLRLDVLDPRDSVMRMTASRTWTLPGFPLAASFPPGGPQLLAVDADGDGRLEVCWAGGSRDGPDSAGVFALRLDGQGLTGPDPLFATLDRRPDPIMAALATGATDPVTRRTAGPALFAVVTRPAFPGDTEGNKVWLLDHLGNPLPGWPAPLPAPVTTPPVFAGTYPDALVLVGCADGAVRALDLNGAVASVLGTLPAPVSGRLAALVSPAPSSLQGLSVAAGDTLGNVAVFTPLVVCVQFPCPGPWQHPVGGPGFVPDFLWIDFAGAGPQSSWPEYSLVVRDVDRLHAFDAYGNPLPGWGRPLPDTLVAALGAGDPDGDGYPEVLVQTRHSGVAFINTSGGPSPGWPRRTSAEDLAGGCAALSADVDGDGRSEVVALDPAGVIAAVRADGRTPAGWPLAAGAGARGGTVIADLDGDGFLEVVAGDNVAGIWAYGLPASAGGDTPVATSWTMLGGDPGRTSALPLSRTPASPAPAPGPLVRASLKAYPNPARRKPVTFGFTLTEPARVEFHVLDVSGHEVASFARDGRQADNLVVWDPGALPAGLYLVRVRIQGARDRHDETLQVGVLR